MPQSCTVRSVREKAVSDPYPWHRTTRRDVWRRARRLCASTSSASWCSSRHRAFVGAPGRALSCSLLSRTRLLPNLTADGFWQRVGVADYAVTVKAPCQFRLA